MPAVPFHWTRVFLGDGEETTARLLSSNFLTMMSHFICLHSSDGLERSESKNVRPLARSTASIATAKFANGVVSGIGALGRTKAPALGP